MPCVSTQDIVASLSLHKVHYAGFLATLASNHCRSFVDYTQAICCSFLIADNVRCCCHGDLGSCLSLLRPDPPPSDASGDCDLLL